MCEITESFSGKNVDFQSGVAPRVHSYPQVTLRQVVSKVGIGKGQRLSAQNAGQTTQVKRTSAPSSLLQVQPVLRGAGGAGPPPWDRHRVQADQGLRETHDPAGLHPAL